MMNVHFLAVLVSSVLTLPLTSHAASEARWWKGNLHTHSLWSDGDDFPEMITAWYRDQGYDFLAISDHNVLHQSERWISIGTNKVRNDALNKYIAKFGTNWVETRIRDGKTEARLKPLTEYRPLFDRPDEFLLIQSEELTDKYKALPIHMNASNIRDFIPAQGGNSVREVMQNNVNAVLEQSRKTGQKILPHLNHPNFVWGVTAEDLAAVRGEHFFEVYNGHPQVHNDGDEVHASTDRMWDIALAIRLSAANPEPLYGIGVDDSHHYHQHGAKLSNSGRGWIMVRAMHLTPESLLRAMERGDFYASSGVLLKDVSRSTNQLKIEIDAQEGVTYRTEFVGTRRGFDTESQPVKDKDGNDLPVTRRYSPQIGTLLAEVEGTHPVYDFQGDELYVRARVISSRIKTNATQTNEYEMAWSQPAFAANLIEKNSLEARSGPYHFTFELAAAPDLAHWTEQKLIPVVQEWYPKLVEMLPSDGFEPATNITIRFRDDMGGTPASASGSRINCNIDWFRRNLDGEAAGSVVHEMAHVVQSYGRARRNNPDATRTPGWIVEGIPDYIRWFLYEPEVKGAEITERNLERARFDASYRITGNFLNWVVSHHGKDVIPKLNAAARAGKYSEEIWQELTGKSLQELGAAWRDEHTTRLKSAAGR